MKPLIIHQIWVGEEMPNHIKRALDWNRTINKNFEYILWNEERLYKEFGKNYIENILSEAIAPAFATNIFRLDILKKYGGIYMDADVKCLKEISTELFEDDKIYCDTALKKCPGVSVIIAQKGTDFSKVLNAYELDKPIIRFWWLMKSELTTIEPKLFKETFKNMRLRSWLKHFEFNPRDNHRRELSCD